MPIEKFWCVWVDGKQPPTKQHLHKSEAVAEAGRLFAIEGKRAYVMGVEGYHDIVASAYKDMQAPQRPEYLSR